MQHFRGDGSAVGGEARSKLATTLGSVLKEAVYDQTALRDDVCNFVRESKHNGLSAQAVIIAARNLVREIAGEHSPSERTENLLTKMLGWCLDEYYKESG
ncbi:MAG: hypothetical protein M3Z17_04060 [Gemmatimonadota bacterium]|nr:hypothetical protein [Gemmatimonadota bacterium]